MSERTVTVLVGRKENLGNYNMLDLQCSVTDYILDSESIGQAILRVARELEPSRKKIMDGLREQEKPCSG